MKKPWYKRRRYWMLALLATLIYFCFIPSRLQVSPQTTGFTEPLLPNGDVDYFGAYEKTYIHKLSPPEDNGYRLLLAACGPRILEQAAMMDAVPWEQLPTHEISKNWFETRWLPLCEHMYIDPYAKPKYLDLRDFDAFLRSEWQAKQEDKTAHYDRGEEDRKLREKLAAAPWTAEEYPDIARWIEERSPVLDLFGAAVRKPNYACYRWRDGAIFSILLPDVQSTRAFGRELQVRVTERLGKEDIEGAWYDAMSMLYLARNHYLNDPFLVVDLVGISMNNIGLDSAKLVLRHDKLTPEQRERFAKELEFFPRQTTLFSKFELHMVYSTLQLLQRLHWLGDEDEQWLGDWLLPDSSEFYSILSHFTFVYLPFDRNIAGKRITEILDQFRTTGDWAENIQSLTTSTVSKKYYANMEKHLQALNKRLKSPKTLLRIPLIHTRSELIADTMICLLMPAMSASEIALDHANVRYDLLRMEIALERYKLTKGEYPPELEALVPTYLEEVPLDPPSGRKSWTYKLAPDDETAYLLHSSAWEENGEDKRTKELFVRKKTE